MGCVDHPTAVTLTVEPPVARYRCVPAKGQKPLPGCTVILKPANDPEPADCLVCKKARVRADLDGVQFYCAECGVQVI
jgi:hypothetical protein